jgi:ferredoxin
MPTVNFVNEKTQIEVPQGSNLRAEARKAGVQLYPGLNKVFNCHGFGQCGSCRVLVTKGMESTGKKSLIERFRLGLSMAYIGNEDTMRLACQTRVEGDIEVVTQPPLNLFGESFFS